MYCRCNPGEPYDGPTVVCAWCQKIIKPGLPEKGESHGICPDCYKGQIEELRRQRKTPPQSRSH